MDSRSRLKVVVGRWGRPASAIGLLVLVGVAVTGLANIFWIDGSSDDALPGVALGSHALLVVERAVAFFAAWLLVLVVVAQAFKGRLPTEISGRGVRYADADAAQAAAADTEAALNVVRRDVAHLRDAVFVLEGERETRDRETI